MYNNVKDADNVFANKRIGEMISQVRIYVHMWRHVNHSVLFKYYLSTLWKLLNVHAVRNLLSEPDFYGDLVYKLKKIVGSNNFSAQFIKIISHYKKIGYNINVLQQTACLVVNPITVGTFAFLFNCTPVGQTSDSMMVPT